MSIINSQPLIGASGNQVTGYNLTRSLRFRSSASAYLSRTPASAGNRKTWTWSAWVKRGSFTTTRQCLFGGWSSDSDSNWLEFGFGGSTDGDTNDSFYVTTATVGINSSAVFRDPSAWYHIVVVVDTTQATAANRFRLWINGVNQNLSALSSLSLNLDAGVNQASNHSVSKSPRTGTTRQFDGYMAEVNFVDGQQLEPSSFGETDTATGVWKPKKYTGTYGTNGFYLKFDNLTSTSTLGNDSSGNSNTWTVNNISLTSGATYDSMKDVPTLTDADTANYCVLNVLGASQPVTVSNANLTVSCGNGSTYGNIIGSMAIPSSGKYYFEAVCTSNAAQATWGLQSNPGSGTNRFEWYSGTIYYNGTSTSGATYATNDVLALAIDVDGGTIYTYKNGTLQNTVSYNISALTLFPYFGTGFANTIVAYNANFGQRPFAYTPPSGFKALNTFNLPTPTIGATASTQANDYFDVATYAGDGTSTRTITTSPNFTPDLYWLKNRTDGFSHLLYDRVRGAGENADLASNTTAAEGDNNTNSTFGFVSAFTNDGITVVKGSNSVGYTNTSGHNYVVWQWRASGSTVSNTAGSQTSTVSVNTSAGFSIATFTCTGLNVNGTVGHGLGVAPNMIITKSRGSGSNWVVYHSSVSTDVNKFLRLNDTSALTTLSQIWGDALPTSTVFGIRGDVTLVANATAVAYCFAEVAGYSKFGSYTGNGSTDGPFIYTGFRPRFILWKKTNTSTNAPWVIADTARSTVNIMRDYLLPNASDAEATIDLFDVVSNGFKWRGTPSGGNANGDTYIYAAFAETPFKYSLAR